VSAAFPQQAVFPLGIAARGGPAEGDREEHAHADPAERRDKDGCRRNHRV